MPLLSQIIQNSKPADHLFLYLLPWGTLFRFLSRENTSSDTFLIANFCPWIAHIVTRSRSIDLGWAFLIPLRMKYSSFPWAAQDRWSIMGPNFLVLPQKRPITDISNPQAKELSAILNHATRERKVIIRIRIPISSSPLHY